MGAAGKAKTFKCFMICFSVATITFEKVPDVDVERVRANTIGHVETCRQCARCRTKRWAASHQRARFVVEPQVLHAPAESNAGGVAIRQALGRGPVSRDGAISGASAQI